MKRIITSFTVTIAVILASVFVAPSTVNASFSQNLGVCERRYYNWPGTEGMLFMMTNTADRTGFWYTANRRVPNNSACDDLVVRYDDLFNRNSGLSVPYNFAPCAAFVAMVTRGDGRQVFGPSKTICQGGIDTLWTDIGDAWPVSVRVRQLVYDVAGFDYAAKITVWK